MIYGRNNAVLCTRVLQKIVINESFYTRNRNDPICVCVYVCMNVYLYYNYRTGDKRYYTRAIYSTRIRDRRRLNALAAAPGLKLVFFFPSLLLLNYVSTYTRADTAAS